MDEKYEVSELVRVVPVERVTLVSTRGFDDVVAACCWRRNVGHPRVAERVGVSARLDVRPVRARPPWYDAHNEALVSSALIEGRKGNHACSASTSCSNDGRP